MTSINKSDAFCLLYPTVYTRPAKEKSTVSKLSGNNYTFNEDQYIQCGRNSRHYLLPETQRIFYGHSFRFCNALLINIVITIFMDAVTNSSLDSGVDNTPYYSPLI